MSTRQGGCSASPYDTLNLSLSVGDAAAAVAENRRRWALGLAGATVQAWWPPLVHGAAVARLQADGRPDGERAVDAVWSSEPGVVCQVTAADCLPVLLAFDDGRAVAAAHAGWRGLAAGVLRATVAAMCQGMAGRPAALQAWLGPCIGPAAFEVGVDVLLAFGASAAEPGVHFRPLAAAAAERRWLADLPALAAAQLRQAGLTQVQASGWCTASDQLRFFSHRRSTRLGQGSGRMAAAIWRCVA